MSQINVNRIKDSNKGAPDFPSGVNVGGITSTVTLGVTNLNPTNVNVSGVVTATTLDGNLLATGTPTLGLGVTINTSGVNISGVATAGIVSATTLYGDGSNLTGIALTIAPLNYNPAVFGVDVGTSQGIGITFNQGVKAGSGNVTLRLVGAAGTVVENFGVGNSVTYGDSDYGTTITITPTADLEENTVYHLSYPSGAFTNIGGDVSYVGTGYTFDSVLILQQLWGIGPGHDGQGGQNNTVAYSSPVQLTGTTWKYASSNNDIVFATKTDGTLWQWGNDNYRMVSGGNGARSSPVQTPGTTWNKLSNSGPSGTGHMGFIKTDGTLWTMGYNVYGQLGDNSTTNRSSPTQLAGTTWKQMSHGHYYSYATKTDGTLWAFGEGQEGQMAQNDRTNRSSPIQIPGTTWAWNTGYKGAIASKTDGTLWSWGNNEQGNLGQNNQAEYSSPVQIPGTTWPTTEFKMASLNRGFAAIKTDGTLWAWGWGVYGQLGVNSEVTYSSPVQIGTETTWSTINVTGETVRAIKTDGTLWAWGQNSYGQLGQNDTDKRSSPVQVGSATDWVSGGQGNFQRRNA